MATLIIVGSQETRIVARPGGVPLVYTPRVAAEVST
jgi:precorrin-3B C17-methyltransferase